MFHYWIWRVLYVPYILILYPIHYLQFFLPRCICPCSPLTSMCTLSGFNFLLNAQKPSLWAASRGCVTALQTVQLNPEHSFCRQSGSVSTLQRKGQQRQWPMHNNYLVWWAYFTSACLQTLATSLSAEPPPVWMKEAAGDQIPPFCVYCVACWPWKFLYPQGYTASLLSGLMPLASGGLEAWQGEWQGTVSIEVSVSTGATQKLPRVLFR